MTPFTVASLARADLVEIWDYVARDNPSAADKVLATLHEKFLLLAGHPLLGQLRQELRPDLRSLAAGNYIIYYQVDGNRIRVVRVLHAARDVERII